MAYEAARILHHMGCDVRVFDPKGLPVKDDVQHDHPKVQELRGLSLWSDAQFWSSPEQHGNITAVMKNQSEQGNSFSVSSLAQTLCIRAGKIVKGTMLTATNTGTHIGLCADQRRESVV
jgi:hypothetical protein